jgi:hypothetical protein
MKPLAQSRPAQRGLGEFPTTIVKIALSKPTTSVAKEETDASGSYKSREEPTVPAGRECQRGVTGWKIRDRK